MQRTSARLRLRTMVPQSLSRGVRLQRRPALRLFGRAVSARSYDRSTKETCEGTMARGFLMRSDKDTLVKRHAAAEKGTKKRVALSGW